MTRYIVLGLIAAASATAGAAYAQGEAPAAPPVPPPPPAAAAPPAAPAPAPAPAAAPAPAPTAAIGPYLLTAIEKVCEPLIQGQQMKDVSKATGLRRTRDAWQLQGPGVERVIITPPSVANPTVCQMSVNYEVGETDGVVGLLNNWAAAQNPPLQVLSAGYAAGPGVTGWTWEYDGGGAHEGLVFNHQTADGKPASRGFEVGTLLFSHNKGG